MIGSLRGRITSKSPPQVTVEVGGVGYELEAPMSTFLHLPAVGEEVKLLTHFVVREDAQLLYGFATEDERHLFRSLLKVSGIGPKIGLALLSGMSVEAVATAIRNQDVDSLIRVPGIGRKTAERMLIEMRDRLAPASGGTPGSIVLQPGAAPEAEAYAALVGLGYRPAEATRLLKAAGPGTHSTEELIRRALQSAARD
jgi:Holliday junction DNA helicase RuvA